MKSRTAIVAIVAFVVIAISSAVLIVRMTVNSINATAAAQAAQAPEIARLYIEREGSLAKAAQSIVNSVKRDGLNVILLDDETQTAYNGSRTWHMRGGPRFRHAYPDAAGAAPPLPPGIGDPFGGPAPPGGPRFEGPVGAGGHPVAQGSFRFPWLRLSIAAIAGETAQQVRIPGGWMRILPGPEPVLAVMRTVLSVLAVLLLASGFALWMCVRGIRRAALQPLVETTLALQRLASRDFSPRRIVAGEASAYNELARAYNAAVEAVSSSFAERRAAEAEMQRFIADAGHELRTPLTIVMGYLDIIDGGALSDPNVAGRITTGMRTEAIRMRKLIDKLIILARMETPSDVEARSNVDVVSLVARVIESLEPLTTQPMNVAGVPFAHVFVNEDDLADALTNIIENAIKYAPLSPIEISVERHSDRIVTEISDCGPGMTTAEQRNAFERFFRGDNRGDVSGSGLGLAIAKRAIERAGGTLSLRSVPGSGTTFTIALPEMPIAVDDAPRLAHR